MILTTTQDIFSSCLSTVLGQCGQIAIFFVNFRLHPIFIHWHTAKNYWICILDIPPFTRLLSILQLSLLAMLAPYISIHLMTVNFQILCPSNQNKSINQFTSVVEPKLTQPPLGHLFFTSAASGLQKKGENREITLIRSVATLIIKLS